jgi:hypothetical protein
VSKTVSARITKETHDKLMEMCNQVGCTVNDYLNGAIELALTGSTDKDLGDGMDGEFADESKSEPKFKLVDKNESIPKARITKISYDGKTWINLH